MPSCMERLRLRIAGLGRKRHHSALWTSRDDTSSRLVLLQCLSSRRTKHRRCAECTEKRRTRRSEFANRESWYISSTLPQSLLDAEFLELRISSRSAPPLSQ